VVASTATEQNIEALQALHRELEASATPERQDRERFFEVNERFHMLLLEIASNRWRNQMVADLRKVMKLNRHNSLLKSGRIEESLNEHRALMAALSARDKALAMQRMQEHFKHGLEAAN
jgi:DNA-binding GntR family transcriptional regulator